MDVKKAICTALAFGIMLISGAVFAEEGPPTIQTLEKDQKTARNTNSIKELSKGDESYEGPCPHSNQVLCTFYPPLKNTEKKKSQREPPETLIKRVIISENGTVTIYYSNNTKTNSRALNSEKEEPEDKNITASRIILGFINLTGSRKADELSQKELDAADDLMREYYGLVFHDQTFLNQTYGEVLARWGNRYKYTFERIIDQAPLSAIIAFYNHYIGLSYQFARDEDQPTDGDKRSAIRILKEQLLKHDTGPRDSFSFFGQTDEEIKRLDPETYQLLQQIKM